METRMQLIPETTQPSDSAKKPYQAPELVVMGDATEMTQLTIGGGSDAIVSDTGS